MSQPSQVAVYSIHHDPAYWPLPEEFWPERFLKVCVCVLGVWASWGRQADGCHLYAPKLN